MTYQEMVNTCKKLASEYKAPIEHKTPTKLNIKPKLYHSSFEISGGHYYTNTKINGLVELSKVYDFKIKIKEIGTGWFSKTVMVSVDGCSREAVDTILNFVL